MLKNLPKNRDMLCNKKVKQKRRYRGPMGRIGGTIKNFIFRKIKSRHVISNTLSEFANVAKKFVPGISMVYMPWIY